MTLFLENSFSLNNYISISKKIKQIPMYFLYFLPIDTFKNLDNEYKVLPMTNSNLVQREIKYKLVYFDKDKNRNKEIDLYSNNIWESLPSTFAKSIYHIFYSCFILHKHDISFTLSSQPFVSHGGNLPQLTDFSYSFYFPVIQTHNLKLYFSPVLLQNPYVSFDVFVITYLIHHPIECLCEEDTDRILELFTKTREKIELNTFKNIISYFHKYNSIQVIQYLFQFKYAWTYYSLCYFFIIHYPDLLEHFSLYNLFHTYIHSSFKERHAELLADIHMAVFA
jgi:hypothetical protein